ncbi:MAG: beta-glucanase, partial [Bacteroidaceae bacterium]|nr:beta-glucanase [Bacteroidaceae bacterium]
MKQCTWYRGIAMLITSLWMAVVPMAAQDTGFKNGQLWPDTEGHHINAHGGNVLRHGDTYYWYGEQRPDRGFTMDGGIAAYSSTDLKNWKNEGLALHLSAEAGSDIERGCIIERPKVVWNERHQHFVMFFHLELKGRGYEAARVGFAVSEHATGPFRFIRSTRLHAGRWPF